MNTLKKLVAAVTVALPAAFIATNAAAADDVQFVLPDTQNYSVLYGDFYSYSAPILDHWFPTGNGSTAGGAPMTFSSPLTGNGGPAGVITVDHQLNVFSYSGGQETTNQPSGAENGYTQGTNPYFTTNTTPVTTFSASDPTNGTTQIADNKDTWDVNLATLNSMLTADGVTGGVATMVFNNNEGNAQENQELSVWMQWIVWDSGVGDAAGDLIAAPIVFTLANSCTTAGGNVCLSGGVLGDNGGYVSGPGKDPTLYSELIASNPYPDVFPGTLPVAGVPQPEDFVISGGSVCMKANGTLFNCADGATPAETYNHNLGADRMSYIVFSQEFNTFLAAWQSGAYADYDMFSVDLRTGCFQYSGTSPNKPVCEADPTTGLYPTNGGNERAFLARAIFDQTVPEPAPLLLIAIGLLAMGFTRRKA